MKETVLFIPPESFFFSHSGFRIKAPHWVNIVRVRSFWSTFSRIWTEYADLQSKSPYSVRI